MNYHYNACVLSVVFINTVLWKLIVFTQFWDNYPESPHYKKDRKIYSLHRYNNNGSEIVVGEEKNVQLIIVTAFSSGTSRHDDSIIILYSLLFTRDSRYCDSTS